MWRLESAPDALHEHDNILKHRDAIAVHPRPREDARDQLKICVTRRQLVGHVYLAA